MTKRGSVRDKPEANAVIDRPREPIDGAKLCLGDDRPLNDIMGAYEGPGWERILENIKRNRKIEDREEAPTVSE